MRAAAIIAIATLSLACSARRLGGAASSGSGDAGSDDDVTYGATSSGPGSGTDDGPSLEHCGDGKLDPGEQCDDGNDVDADGCNIDCVPSGLVRWSMPLDGVRCWQLAADQRGGVFMSGTNESNQYWIARIAEPGEIVWQTPDGGLPAPLIGLSDGVLVGWENLPSPPQGLVLAYDESEMVRSETVLDDPDVEELDFFRRARVAVGQDPVLVTNTGLSDGSDRLTFWRFDTEGKVVGARVVAEGINLPQGDHVVAASNGSIVLATSKNSLDSISAYMPSGQLLWEKTLPETHDLYDLDSASDGSLFAVFMYSEGAEGPYVNLVERYAPDGSLRTSWVLASTNEGDQGTDAVLAVDAKDDVLVAARYFNETAFVYTELRLVKHTAEGEQRWSQSWDISPGNNGSSYQPRGLVVAANGDALLMFDDPAEGLERCSIVAVAP